jgi:hypothetical protein
MRDRMAGGMKSASGGALIELVHEGMTVVDASGDKIGDVEYVQMGDPAAATTEGNDLDEPGLLGNVAEVFVGDEREPDVQEPLRSQLQRIGFVKVDGPGLTDTDRHVRADLVASVAGDTVTLTVSKGQLPRED